MKIAIIGGGLVGSLSACYFGNRGHQVDLFEYREDIRCAQLAKGRSINLALSTRGRRALREVGLEDALLQHAIPMKGRMIHQLDSTRYPLLYDTKSHQCIYSVSRRFLNESLLNAAEKYDNVNLHFEHKLLDANMREGNLTLIRESSNETLKHTADLVVGADGAFSTVRRLLMRQPLFNFSQTYIEHGYLELCMPPTEDNDFAMEPNYLHIWPRGTFMMIALPNQDRSWTVTLFMPFANFKKLDSAGKLVEFFMREFPDAVPLIGKERLVSDFFAAKASALVSIKCNPYHFEDKFVIIGDAAHAMVPFYGQGMNAGFEDCQILDKIIQSHILNLSEALKNYSSMRNIDAEAICDLAMYNYMEMRDLVNQPSFLLRKQLDNFLFWTLPNIWVPLYFSVTFTSMRYHLCCDNKKWQEKLLNQIFAGIWIVGLVAVLTAIFLWWPLFD